MGHEDLPEEGRLELGSYQGPLAPGIGIPALRKLRSAGRLGPADLRFVSDLYDGEIAFTDHFVAKVLDPLRTLGLFDDSLIVFTSDHGEEFLYHGDFGHARTLFDELIRVPMIIKLPGQTEGRVSNQLSGHVDLLPTILEILKIDVDHEVSGVDVLSNERTADEGARPIFSETDRRKNVRAVIRKNFSSFTTCRIATGSSIS
jgi:arylsulfatase A-like enzyme